MEKLKSFLVWYADFIQSRRWKRFFIWIVILTVVFLVLAVILWSWAFSLWEPYLAVLTPVS